LQVYSSQKRDEIKGEKPTKTLSKETKEVRYDTFEKFYPFYLTEHLHPINRGLHFIGTTISILLTIYFVSRSKISMLFFPILVGYAFAWVGHFFFEKNRPATFKYPLYSFISDFRMWFEIVTGKTVIDERKK